MEDKIELKAIIKTFYRNIGIEIDDDKIVIPLEEYSIIDAMYEDNKFQIKNVPDEAKAVDELLEKGEEAKKENVEGYFKEINKKIGKKAIMSFSYTFEKFKEEYIKKPMRKLIGYSGSGIILLLYAGTTGDHPFNINQEIIYNDPELFNLFKKSAFKKVYLIDERKNIILYRDTENPKQKVEELIEK